MKPRQRPGAILFDLDGTLVHSLPDIAESLNALFAEQGWEPFEADAVRKMVGGGIPKLVERALKARSIAFDEGEHERLSARFREIYAPRAAHLSRPFPGVVEFLQTLRDIGVPLGVVTNKPEAITRKMLEALDLSGFFGAVVGGDTLATKKPDPETVLAALEQLGTSPDKAVLVGDSPADAGAGRNAGVPVVLVSFGYSQVPVAEIEADGLVYSFDALPAALERLGYVV